MRRGRQVRSVGLRQPLRFFEMAPFESLVENIHPTTSRPPKPEEAEPQGEPFPTKRVTGIHMGHNPHMVKHFP